MPIRNEATLKKYFEAGERPQENHFVDLIDTIFRPQNNQKNKSIELTNEGQKWTVEAGSLEESLVSLRLGYGKNDTPDWVFNLTPLVSNSAVNELSYTMNVNATVISGGRQGKRILDDIILADGKWHDISLALSTSECFEVVAGVEGSKHASLMHAIAAYTPVRNPPKSQSRQSIRYWLKKAVGVFSFLKRKKHLMRSANNKNDEIGMSYTHSLGSLAGHQLELRWFFSKVLGAEVLQIRSQCACLSGSEINYHLTSLWGGHVFANSVNYGKSHEI